MNTDPRTSLAPPRIERIGPLLIAGIAERYEMENLAGIPMQWQRLRAGAEALPPRADANAYGVCLEPDATGAFDYLCGFAIAEGRTIAEGGAIADGRDLAPDFRAVRIPARRHLVFRHEGHVSAIGATWNAVMNVWLPASEYRMAHAPSFERCLPSFDPHTGMGGIDICVPVEG